MRRRQPCACQVCRADRTIRAIGEIVIWVAVFYFGGHLFIHLINLYLKGPTP